MLAIMKGLKSRNYEVMNVISGWNNGVFPKLLQEAGIPFEAVKLGKFSKNIRSPYLKWTLVALINYPGALLKTQRIIKAFKPDLLFFDNHSSIFLLNPVLGNLPILIRQAEQPSLDFFFKMLLKSPKILKRITFLGISKFITKELRKIGISETNLCLLYTGFVIPDKPKPSTFNHTKLTLGCIGQIGEWKGQEDFIYALKILKDKNLPIFGKIVGSGDQQYLDKINQIIKTSDLENHVLIKGYTNQVESFYHSIDLCIVPSRVNEALGRVAAEASSYGIPIIVTNRGGLPELTVEGITGFVVPDKDPSAIAEKISWFFQNPGMLQKFGKSARSFIIQNFSFEQKMDQLDKKIEVFSSPSQNNN